MTLVTFNPVEVSIGDIFLNLVNDIVKLFFGIT